MILENKNLKTAKIIMLLAAIYNLVWGALISLWPSLMLFGHQESTYILILIRCIGMLVGVYGIAYFCCYLDPTRYWPLILVGFIGKALGPIGSLYYIIKGELVKDFFIINIFNDIIWIIPFAWILVKILKK